VKKDTLAVIVGLGLILIATLVLLVTVGISEEEREYIFIRKIDFKLEEVDESHAKIRFIVTVQRTKSVTNATLLAFVHDKLTNLLLGKFKLKIPKKDKEGLQELNLSISFEKDKDYNVFFEIRKENTIVSSKGIVLKGLKSLVPKDKELKLFLKDVDFEILGIVGSKVTVGVKYYLESMSNYSLTLHIKAIQYESNILAAEKWMQAEIEKGKTILVKNNLTVPKDYNYLIKLEVWRENSLLKVWSNALNLAPKRKIPANITEKEIKFEVSEFIKPPFPAPTPVPTPLMAPEFGIVKGYKPETLRYKPATLPGFSFYLTLLSIGGLILWKMRKTGK